MDGTRRSAGSLPDSVLRRIDPSASGAPDQIRRGADDQRRSPRPEDTGRQNVDFYVSPGATTAAGTEIGAEAGQEADAARPVITHAIHIEHQMALFHTASRQVRRRATQPG